MNSILKFSPDVRSENRGRSDGLRTASHSTADDSNASGANGRRPRVALLTSWKQECGIAEYSRRLAEGMPEAADFVPHNLENLLDDTRLKRPSAMRRYFRELMNRVRQCQPDVVHIQHEYSFFGQNLRVSNQQFRRVVEKSQAPVVVTLHTLVDEALIKPRFTLKSWTKQPLRNWTAVRNVRNFFKALKGCEQIVVHTHDTQCRLLRAFPQLKRKLQVIPIPIEQVEYAGTEPAAHKQPGETWVVLPGFISPYKGHVYALRALKLLPKRVKLVIAGGRHPKDNNSSTYWMSLLDMIEQMGLQSRVVFTGYLQTAAEHAAVLSQADLFLLPYDEVGQSGSAVLADSLAYDKPVVTSRAKSMFAYRMHADTIYCTACAAIDDPKALASTIRSQLEGHDERFSQQRAVAIERYSMKSASDTYSTLYERLVATANSARSGKCTSGTPTIQSTDLAHRRLAA